MTTDHLVNTPVDLTPAPNMARPGLLSPADRIGESGRVVVAPSRPGPPPAHLGPPPVALAPLALPGVGVES